MSAEVHTSREAKEAIAAAVETVLQTKQYVRFLKLKAVADFDSETDDQTTDDAEDQQLVTGVVLVPEVADAHGDIISAEVIQAAAHQFLAEYNSRTTIGIQHTDMDPPIDLVESYIAPMDFVLGNQTIIKGSWIITVRVNDDDIWGKVKEGKLTGFSIGGKAQVQDIETENEAA